MITSTEVTQFYQLAIVEFASSKFLLQSMTL
jgi:hypothetical protein